MAQPAPAGHYGMTQTTWLRYLSAQMRRKLRRAKKHDMKDDIKKYTKIVKQCERDESRWANRHQPSLFGRS